MDFTEDLSARVLFRNILSTEQPRTPITRSSNRTVETSSVRRSSRLSTKNTQNQSVQDILRRSFKDKVRESITRKSATTRRNVSERLKQGSTPGPASLLYDESDTPRHLLRNILLTEPVKSPVHHEERVPDEPQLPSTSSGITSKRSSIEHSNLDLPDLTIANVGTTRKGLSRKRHRQSPNVTAFEKRLQDRSGFQREHDESLDDYSSLSLSSSTSLSLKTPFVDVQTERRGLQRRLHNRRKITVEEFGAALSRFQSEDNQEKVDFLKTIDNTATGEGFSLSLDFTSDIVNCTTAFYPHSDLNSQRQTEMENCNIEKEKSVCDGRRVSQSEKDEVAADGHQEGGGDLTEEAVGNGDDSSPTTEDVHTGSKPDVEEASHHSDEDGGVDQSVADEEGCYDHQEVVAPSESDDEAEPRTDCEEEKEEEEDLNTSEELKRISRRAHRSLGELVARVSEAEDCLPDTTEIVHRDRVSTSLETGGHEDIPPRSCTPDLAELSTEEHEDAQETEAETSNRENVLLDLTHKSQRGSFLSDSIPAQEEAAPAADLIEQNEESEDDGDDSDGNDMSCKTPAFVKEKRNFFIGEHNVFPSVLTDAESSNTGKVAPAAKPKRIRRKRETTENDLGLPQSYLMSVFRHFAKTKVSPDIYPVLKDTMDKYFDRLTDDLESYAHHAKRKTIEMEDAVLLLKRQGYVNDKVPVEVLIEKYLRMEQRKILIPIATSGNIVVPKQRR